MLRRTIETAWTCGISHLSFETGPWYVLDPNSIFMCLDLQKARMTGIGRCDRRPLVDFCGHVLNETNQIGHFLDALGRNEAEFSKVGTKGVDQHGALLVEKRSRAMQRGQRLGLRRA